MFELKALYIKPRAGAPMQRVDSATGIAGHGLVGDANADPTSPRQVLLVSERDLRFLKLKGDDLRANFVVRGDFGDLASGSVLTFGSLALRITMACEPCGRLNEVRAGLSGDIGSRRGLLARVLSNGKVSVSDRGHTLNEFAQPLAADWRERVFAILMSLPPGNVLGFAALARAAGVQTAYCRAIPSVLRGLATRGAPVHRVLPADTSKLDPQVVRQLRNEGVDPHGNRSSYAWDARLYYSAQENAWHEIESRHVPIGTAATRGQATHESTPSTPPSNVSTSRGPGSRKRQLALSFPVSDADI
jgi:alkylated DNA nucleotide flippase Atl1